MKLDRSRPFGKISGETFIPDGCDRPAAYEQGGKFFDSHDRLIVAGVSASIVPTGDDDDDPTAGDGMSVADLLRDADTMHWRTFKTAAKKMLGTECPATKPTIIEALRAVQREFDARANKRAKDRTQPQTAPTKPDAAEGGVDLGAWARGHKEYLFGDVRKSIMSKYGRKVTERDDAVDFLVSQEVLSAAEARQDVVRNP